MNMSTGIALGMGIASNSGPSTKVGLVCSLIMLGIAIITLIYWFFK